MTDRVCDVEFDDAGYPTDKTLDIIREWDDLTPSGRVALLDYVQEAWRYPERVDRWVGNEEKKLIQYNFSTGGWSGNEDLIGALMDNNVFWLLCWHSSRRGGHYTFQTGRFGQ